jgi:hypothetical protein
MTQTAVSARLTEAEVRQMVLDWYEKLDVHAPMVDILPLLVPEGAYMKFPEVTFDTLAGFEAWYQRVIRTFFDEVHTMKELNIKVNEDGTQADINLVVRWEASVWTPGDRLSKRIKMDAVQSWVVVPSSLTGKPAIKSYSVDELRFDPDSATL